MLFGIVLILFGCFIIITPRLHYPFHGFYFDLTGINIPLGIVLIAFGIFFTWTNVVRRLKGIKNGYLICPKCEDSFSAEEVPDQRCPNCGVDLEDLKGFYENRPQSE